MPPPSLDPPAHEPKLLVPSRIKFIRSKLNNFSAHVPGVTAEADD